MLKTETEQKKQVGPKRPKPGRPKSDRPLKQMAFRIYADQLPISCEEVRAAIDEYKQKNKFNKMSKYRHLDLEDKIKNLGGDAVVYNAITAKPENQRTDEEREILAHLKWHNRTDADWLKKEAAYHKSV